MKNQTLKIFKNKNLVYIIGIILIIFVILIFYLNRKNYEVYLDLYMPSDSYGYVIYSPSNQNEFNLYKNSYLNIEYTFNDNKNRKIEFIISDNNIIEIKNNKIYAKNIGTTSIYIKTKDDVKSNIVNINVVKNDE
ncbi:MAG: hypothetical protein IJO32_06305 [Bacilli bacterium]|nr:hypothetical protein [Bacilli bacterium]